MQGTVPPYALDTIPFRFPALALCAGRAPLGGDRDLVLGVYTAARLAQALLPPIRLESGAGHTGGNNPGSPNHHTGHSHGNTHGNTGSATSGTSRADRAKTWLSGLTMPQPARMALLRTFDATAAGPAAAADAIAELARTVTGHIDAPSQQELSDLVEQLRLYYEHHSERGSHGRS